MAINSYIKPKYYILLQNTCIHTGIKIHVCVCVCDIFHVFPEIIILLYAVMFPYTKFTKKSYGNSDFFLLFLLYYYCTGGTLWHLQMFLCILYLNSLPPSFSFIPILPISEIFLPCKNIHTWIFIHSVPFSYMST
jgi:hypothetical protein